VKHAARASRRALYALVPVAIMALLNGGCGGGPDSMALNDGIGAVSEKASTTDAMTPEASAPCEEVTEGCPCERDGETVQCAGPTIHTGNYTSCEPGKRTCLQGTWGPCAGKTVYKNAH
jgi:hypothetical protein